MRTEPETTEENEDETELAAQQARLEVDANDTADAIVKKFREQFGQGSEAKIKLQRRKPGGSMFEFVKTLPLDELDLDFIARTWGGGTYKAQAINEKGKFGKQTEFAIDERIIAECEKKTPSGGNDTVELLKLLVTRLDNKPAGPDPTMLMMMENSKQTMTMLMESGRQQTALMVESMKAIAGKPQAPAMDVTGIIAAMAPILVEVIRRPAPVAASTGGTLKETLENMAVIKEIAGDNGEETMFDKISKILGPIAGPAINALMMRQQQAGGMPQTQVDTGTPSPQQITGGAEPSPQAPGQPQPVTVGAMLRPYMGMLASAAARGGNPGTYVDLVLDTQPDEVIAVVLTALQNPDWQSIVFENHAAVKQFPQWFAELRKIALESVTLNDNAQPPANPSANGATSTPAKPGGVA